MSSFAYRSVQSGLMRARRFTVYKDADLFDFINAPVGKGLPMKEKLRPLIAGQSVSAM